MYRAIVILSMMLLSPLAHADERCRGCDAAQEGKKGQVTGKGKPDSGKICFVVDPSDPTDSVSVTITYKNGVTKAEPFKRGAMVAFGGKNKPPAVCLDDYQLDDAIEIVVIPGSKETCATLEKPSDIKALRDRTFKGVACLRASCNP